MSLTLTSSAENFTVFSAAAVYETERFSIRRNSHRAAWRTQPEKEEHKLKAGGGRQSITKHTKHPK
jgi:hypothetical protein